MAVDPVSLAITVALTAANMAMTAMQTFEGPRVKGAPATVADYGTPLNYFLGTRLVNCPCFFAKPIQEVRKKRKGKGGKQVSYTGFGSFAIHIADHDIGGVLQVWFDNHLVYDNTGSTEKIYPLADDYELEAHMRVYLGTETQDPDPDMLAYIEARDEEADTCPAYRGTSYIYFEGIPLEMLGNRYPDVKVLAYQNSALTVPDTAEIDFVGQQQATRSGTTAGAISFALSGGTDSTPQAGDFVIIVVSSSRNPLNGDSYHADIDGYQFLTDGYTAESGLSDFTWRAYYKFMGGSPDTSFTPNTVVATSARNAFQVIVLRSVDASVFASEVTSINGIGPASYDLADIVIGGGVFDPGDIGGTASTGHYVFKSLAIVGPTGRALPIVVGGESTATSDEGVGNMLAIYQVEVAGGGGGGRSAKAHFLYGSEVMIGEGTTLAAVLTFLAQRAGLEASEYDFGLVAGDDHGFDGYNWAQATGAQVGEGLCDLFDADLRPHEFAIQALPRGSASAGAIPTTEFVVNDNGPFTIPDKSDSSLPARVFLTYADTTAEQNPNVAMPQGGEASGGEISIDMQTLAITSTRAQQLTERRQRRERFGRIEAEFGLTRQRLAIEPGDVFTPSFDGDAMTMRCAKLTIGADGRMPGEWKRDDPAVAVLPNSEGAPAAGIIPDTMPDAVAAEGFVLDTALLIDAHDQTAPLAYLVAGPDEPGVWTGADFAVSDTGDLDSYTEGWDGIASDSGAIIGTVAGTLPDVAYPWVADLGSSISITINVGELTAATLDELILDGTRNLAAIQSGDGWELVQFMTPTLTGTLTYTITGFLRGVRGTEWAMAGHAPGDAFVVLDNAKLRTLGASEIGDEDFYIVTTTGQAVDQDTAFSLDYTGASHKPYAPVLGTAELDGADWVFDAVRRTRIGGTTLDGQDVPLGEASESWSLDIMDGVAVVRTITGTSLPLTYLEADQITDWAGPLGAEPEANLYQVNPTLSLRGYPLNYPEGVS